MAKARWWPLFPLLCAACGPSLEPAPALDLAQIPQYDLADISRGPTADLVRPDGDNGARLERVHSGVRAYGVYVDDDSSGCSGGVNRDGPAGDAMCVGGAYDFTP